MNNTSICIKNTLLSYKTTNSRKSKIIIDHFEVKSGDVVGIFGPNHIGKSTILKYVAQVHTEIGISGEGITYNGKRYNKSNATPRICYVPQNYAESLLPWYSIKKNIRIFSQALKIPKDQIENNVRQLCLNLKYDNEELMFKEFNFFNDFETKLLKQINELSGGQKQIVANLRALVSDPSIIVMDEPFTAIDIYKGSNFRRKVFDYLKNEKNKKEEEEKITTLVVSHELEEIIEFTDRLFILTEEEGKISFQEENSDVHKREIKNLAKSIKKKYQIE